MSIIVKINDTIFDFKNFNPFLNYLYILNVEPSDINNPEIIRDFILDECDLVGTEILPIVKKIGDEFHVRMYDTINDADLSVEETMDIIEDCGLNQIFNFNSETDHFST